MADKTYCTRISQDNESSLPHRVAEQQMVVHDTWQPPINFDPRLSGETRERSLLHLQQTMGNRVVQRMIDRSHASANPTDDLAQRIQAASSGGRALDSATRHRLQESLNADLSSIRIHTDDEADRLSRSVEAIAFTTGSDIFFRRGAYQPDTASGLRLIAHEAAHTVQQTNGQIDSSSRLTISEPGDASEREAEAVASRVVKGQSTQVHTVTGSTVARDAWDTITGAASDAWDWTKDTASDVGTAVADTASSAWDTTKDTASGIYGGMKTAAGYVRKGEQAFEHGVDWLEDKAPSGAHRRADEVEGIPVLEQLAKGNAWLADQQAQLIGGALKGAGSLVGGVAQMVVDPVDTVIGLERLAEHTPITGTPLKLAHGLYDVAANDRNFGDVLDATFNPIRSFEEDATFYKGMANGLLQPYRESIDKGKYSEAGGRAIFDIGSLFVTGGESAAVEGTADVGRLAGVLGEMGDVARASELGKVARGAELAGMARGAEVGELAKAEELGQLSRGDLFSLKDIEAFGENIESNTRPENVFWELAGQNPRTGGGLQEIVTRTNSDPQQIAYNVNHYISDVGEVRIADMAEVPIGGTRGVGSSVIPENVGQVAESVPETHMAYPVTDSPVMNAANQPVGRSNVEARYHSANPKFPEQGPTVQVNTPSDKFGWAGDKNIAVEGQTGYYMLPDGTWKRISEMTETEGVLAHWPAGR